MIYPVVIALTLFCGISLAGGFFLANIIPPAVICAIICILWIVAIRQHWTWLAHVSFSGVFFIGVAGIWMGLNPTLVALGVIASLFAWDLLFFQEKLKKAHSDDSASQLVTRHLWQLAGLGTASFGLSLIIFHSHFEFSFEWTLIFILAVMAGILYIANMVRKQI